jgi:hypothetical protein
MNQSLEVFYLRRQAVVLNRVCVTGFLEPEVLMLCMANNSFGIFYMAGI